jgi:hypothetical protein
MKSHIQKTILYDSEGWTVGGLGIPKRCQLARETFLLHKKYLFMPERHL